MTLYTNVGGSVKELTQLPIKIDGNIKDIQTVYAEKNGAWAIIFSSGSLIEFINYPYPIRVEAGWKYKNKASSAWTTVSAESSIQPISPENPWSGFIKATSPLSISNFYTESDTVVEYGIRSDGTPLNNGRCSLTSFVNGNRGYVCGGSPSVYYMGGEYTQTNAVDVYDSSGNRTTGTSLSVARRDLTTFINSTYAYICGGSSGNTSPKNTVDRYDSSGNRTTGTSLSNARYNHTAFSNGTKSYVCGGHSSNGETNSVEIYDSSGNRTSGTSLSAYRDGLTSFVNNNKGYVCGGHRRSGDTYYSTVDVYDSSGNRTTGTSLSSNRSKTQSFVNGGKGYVCAGLENTHEWPCGAVDVYDASGNRTSGTTLNVYRTGHTCFVNNNRGYVCGGGTYNGGWEETDSVEVYDQSGNKTFGTLISEKREQLTSFVNNSKGYVCGGYTGSSSCSNIVDVYSDVNQTTYKTHLPITEGSTYTLNGVSGTADISQILTYDTRVTGSIDYMTGKIGTTLDISVVDENDYAVSGAEIFFSDWNLDDTQIVYRTTPVTDGGSGNYRLFYVTNVTGTFPECTHVKFTVNEHDGGETMFTLAVGEQNNPNVMFTIYETYVSYSSGNTATIILCDADGNELARRNDVQIIAG